MLRDLEAGDFVEDSKHVTFIYGFFTQNVNTYYQLYRVSRDSDYIEQIVNYAEAVQWLLKNRPQQLLPTERRQEPLEDPMEIIPHEPAALANFWPHVNAARLLLEVARARQASPSDPKVLQAKGYLRTATRYMASQVSSEYRPWARKRGEEPIAFEPGTNTLRLQQEFELPPRAAQVIEYTPWNQTFFYYATLTAAAKAMEHLQVLEGNRNYQALIELYTRIVQAGLHTLQTQNICVVREGVPYFFHMHTPLRDGESRTRLGFPMFAAEDNAHSKSGAWNLPYVWEAGEQFGCTTALLAGYANTMVLTLDDACMTHKNGKAWPRAHLDSPWYLAASGRTNHPASRLGNAYYHLMAFSPDLVAANRPYSEKDAIWDEPNDLRRLYAGYLLRLWMEQ